MDKFEQQKKNLSRVSRCAVWELVLIVSTLVVFGCDGYLDVKPEKSLQVPSSLTDLRALLDYTDDMNNISAVALEACSDDHYLPFEIWNGLSSITRKNLYVWERDVFNDNLTPGDWAATFVPVYKANLVLETLSNIVRIPDNAQEYDEIKGAALVFRCRSFWEALQLWAKAYDRASASRDLGIPLRLTSDFNQISVRASVEECYERVVGDLKEAVMLLPKETAHVMRPSRAAAFGYLARTYLSMREYELAGLYADSALSIRSSLIDFNQLDASSSFPFPMFNEEIIFNTVIPPQSNTNNGRIDSVLYGAYEKNDLRKKMFFSEFSQTSGGGIGFKGSYYGARNLFNGISTAEMILIRAESLARQKKYVEAVQDINKLLSKRFLEGSFIPYTVGSVEDMLRLILDERRKELLFRGLRWTDLKRLNMEPEYARTISRELNGSIYKLEPNDSRYVLAIPNSVIELTGIPQN